MMEKINESGITFQIEKDRLYYIEKTNLFQSFHNVKSCEFICLSSDNKVMFVEAKSSSPKPVEKESFKNYVAGISAKFRDSFLIFNALKANRHSAEHKKEVPNLISRISIEKAQYLFILVLKGYPQEWLDPIQTQLKIEMSYLRQTWNFPDTAIKVINETIAQRKYNIV